MGLQRLILDFPSQESILDALVDLLQLAADRLVSVALIVLVTFIALRLLRRIVRRVVEEVMETREGSARELRQRAETLASIIESTGKFIILTIAVLTILDNLGLSLAPLLASAGIAGIAIAFGAQSLVADTFNGFFILLEGQYGVGDFVRVGSTSGTVEQLNMRRTVLRSVDGAAVTIPNSEIRVVENLSKGWSRAIVEIAVAPEADIEQVMRILHEELDNVQEDPEFGEQILEQPNILGMTSVEPNRLTFRAFVKTQPLEQWVIGRALVARVRNRMIAEGVPMPPRTVDVLTGPQQQ